MEHSSGNFLASPPPVNWYSAINYLKVSLQYYLNISLNNPTSQKINLLLRSYRMHSMRKIHHFGLSITHTWCENLITISNGEKVPISTFFTSEECGEKLRNIKRSHEARKGNDICWVPWYLRGVRTHWPKCSCWQLPIPSWCHNGYLHFTWEDTEVKRIKSHCKSLHSSYW